MLDIRDVSVSTPFTGSILLPIQEAQNTHLDNLLGAKLQCEGGGGGAKI